MAVIGKTYEERRYYPLPSKPVYDAVVAVARSNRNRIRSATEELLVVEIFTPTTLFSWGQNVWVAITPDGAGSRVLIWFQGRVRPSGVQKLSYRRAANKLWTLLERELGSPV